MTAERPGGGGERGKGETRKSGNARRRGGGGGGLGGVRAVCNQIENSQRGGAMKE